MSHTNLQSPISQSPATDSRRGYGRNFDGSPGDVFTRLEEMLATTPASSLVTRPIKRALLEAAANEIKQLRAELAAHTPKGNKT
jgi:hypothetical protein